MRTWRTSKTTTLTAATAAGLLALTACGNGDDGGDADGDGETLNIALFGEEPYSWLDDDGEPTGATIAIAEEIFGERMGYELDIQETDWDNLIPGLTSENWDVVSAGMSINPERCEQAAFGEPELVYTTALLVEDGNPLEVHDFEDLLEVQESEGITVAALNAGVEIGWLEDVGVDVTGVANAQDGIDFVEGGRADVFALTAISLQTMAGDMDGLEVTEPFSHEISVGAHTFRPEDTELIDEFNEHLAELQESGEYLDIVSEFGFTEAEIPDPEMTAEELCEGDIEALNEKYLDD